MAVAELMKKRDCGKTMTLLMLLVPFVWAFSGVSTKYLSFYISEDEVVVYRFFLSALSTLPLLLWMKIPMFFMGPTTICLGS